MPTYLVTGCAGFVGAQVSERLLAAGHRVVGIDNLNDAYDVRLKQWRLARLEGIPSFVFRRVDLTDRLALADVWREAAAQRKSDGPFDGVVNLAARAGVRYSVDNPWIYLDTNVTGTVNLLELCRQYAVLKLVLASTSSLYGAQNPRPFREDANTDGPLSPYAASKKAAEVLCFAYHSLHGLDVTVLRYFTIYGPAGRPDMSPFRFVQWISEGRPVVVYGDGSQSRDFTYIEDIARGTVSALQPNPMPGHTAGGYEIVNLGSDDPVVLLDFIRLVQDITGAQARLEFRPRHPADMAATWADIHKAERLLGWRPQVRLQEGMERLVAWYQDNRAWACHLATD